MKLQTLLVCGLLVGGVAFAQDSGDRSKLSGTWQLQSQAGNAPATVWMLEEQAAGVHLATTEGDQKKMDFNCALGKECEVKDGGQKVKITLYFNGESLVALETRGNDVVKRRFVAASQGDTMDMELIPVVPSGKTETLHFKRVATTAVASK